MALRVFKISEYDHAAERKQFDAIRAMLEAKYADRTDPCLLIGNYNIEGVELDALLVTTGGFRILEFKNWGGQIVARENGSWTSDGLIIEGGAGRKTPYEQIRLNRSRVAKGLTVLLGQKVQALGATIIFGKKARIDTTQLSGTVKAWLSVCDYTRLSVLMESRNRPVFEAEYIERIPALLRIEEFEPDTLALAAQLDPAPKKGWIVTRPSQSPASASIKLSTLYGDAAKGHDIRASLASSPARLSFPGFAGYTFQDISLAQGEQRTVPLPEVRTDKNGAATLALPPCHHTGTFSATLRIEGFDAAGGRAVARELKALFSPLEVIVGFRPTDGANTLDHVVQNAPAAIEVLALDNTLLPKSLEDLTLTIAQRRYVNALVREQNGEFRYDVSPLTKPFRTEKISLDKEGKKISLDSGEVTLHGSVF